MSERRDETAENFVLFLVVGALVVGVALYGLFLFWPYLVFYVLPIGICAFVFAGIMRASVGPENSSYGFYNYKSLSVVIPGLALLIYLVFYAGSERYVQIDKQGNEIAVKLDWQPVHEAFNKVRRESYSGSFFDSLNDRAKQNVIYDRQEMGFIAWVGLLLGALLFLNWSKDDNDNNKEEFHRLVNERSRNEKDSFNNKSKNLDQIIENNAVRFTREIAELRNDLSAVRAENQVLKARLEFSSEVVRPSESTSDESGHGLLDRDLL